MDANKDTILLIDEVNFVHTGKDLLIQIREFNELIIRQWIRKNTSN